MCYKVLMWHISILSKSLFLRQIQRTRADVKCLFSVLKWLLVLKMCYEASQCVIFHYQACVVTKCCAVMCVGRQRRVSKTSQDIQLACVSSKTSSNGRSRCKCLDYGDRDLDDRYTSVISIRFSLLSVLSLSSVPTNGCQFAWKTVL